MKGTSGRKSQKRRSLEPVAWGAVPVLALGVGVLASGVGIDLFVFALAGLIMFSLDRTVGDRVVERLGPGPGTAVFALAVLGCAWYFLAYSSDDFFTAAEKRGYRTAYYQRTPATAHVPSEADRSTENGYADAPAVLNKETPPDEDTRSKNEWATGPTGEGAVTKSAGVPPSDVTSSRALGIASAARLVFGAPARAPAPAPTRITLSLSPAQVPSARRATLQVVVSAEGRPLTDGVVDFTVNGAGVGRVGLNSRGVAMTTFATHIAGTYEVRARFAGTYMHAPSSSDVHMLRVTRQ